MPGELTPGQAVGSKCLGNGARQRHGVCALTGATGYLGSRIARRLLEDGWTIRSLCRTPVETDLAGEHAYFDLNGDVAAQALAGADALVHAAYDFSAVRRRDVERINVAGSRRLLSAAREAHIERIVLVSSIAAFPEAPSLYGRAKLEIEQAGRGLGAAIIRPGLVWGADSGGMVGSLQRVIERRAVVPAPVPRQLEVRLTHEDDVTTLVSVILHTWPTGGGKLFVAAPSSSVMFTELLQSLAHQGRAHVRLVRVPWRIAWLGLRVSEMIGAKPSFRSDSLLSLVTHDREPLSRATAQAEHYGVYFRPYAI